MPHFQSFAIIPAAGRSRRMGQPKLLLPWGPSTILENVLEAWKASRVTHTIVVTHPDDELLRGVCRRHGVRVVTADPPPPDMKASIGWGLAYVRENLNPQPADAWLVAPADMPALSPPVIDALLAAHDQSQLRILQPALASGRLGHPVLFPWSLADEVPRLPAGVGINALQRQHPATTVPCPFAPDTPDIDTPEDYARGGANSETDFAGG